VSRLLKRLRTHGLIKKVGHTYKYYVTAFGKEVVATALKIRELVIIPQPVRVNTFETPRSIIY
jgi:predicted MarR family transcription regulator